MTRAEKFEKDIKKTQNPKILGLKVGPSEIIEPGITDYENQIEA